MDFTIELGAALFGVAIRLCAAVFSLALSAVDEPGEASGAECEKQRDEAEVEPVPECAGDTSAGPFGGDVVEAGPAPVVAANKEEDGGGYEEQNEEDD